MTEKKRETVTLIIEHEDNRIASDVFQKALKSHIDALNRLSQANAHGKKEVSWFVTKATMNSPFHLDMEPSTNKGSALVGAYIKGVNKLEKEIVRPRHFSNRVLKSVREIASLSTVDEQIVIVSPKYGECRFTQKVRRNIDLLGATEDIESDDDYSLLGKRHKEKSSIKGYLEDILTHSGDYFRLYQIIRPTRSIKCSYNQKLESKVKVCLRRIIIVTGYVEYDEFGLPISVDVDHIEEPDKQISETKIEEVTIDLTNGMKSEDYIRRMRNAD